MPLHYFNCSGYKFILSDNQIDSYADSFFDLVRKNTDRYEVDRDKEGNVYIGRNKHHMEIIYDCIMTNFCFAHFAGKHAHSIENMSSFIDELKYYGLGCIFTYNHHGRFHVMNRPSKWWNENATYDIGRNVFIEGNTKDVHVIFGKNCINLASRGCNEYDNHVWIIQRKNVTKHDNGIYMIDISP